MAQGPDRHKAVKPSGFLWMDTRKPPAWKKGIRPLKPGELLRGSGSPPPLPAGKFSHVDGEVPLWTEEEIRDAAGQAEEDIPPF